MNGSEKLAIDQSPQNNSTQNNRRSHESAIAHVTGAAVYTDDQRLPTGMVSLYPVLSPHAHARILKVDGTTALALEGVLLVLTAADIPGKNDTGAIRADEPLLPTDEVSYWGQPVVWVVGETETAARLGAEQVQIEYEPLEAILSIEEAIAANQFHSTPDICHRGDPEAVFAQTDHILEGEVTMNGQDHFYLETQASWAIPDPEGNIQVYSSTQHPTATQQTVAQVLGWPDNRVVVTCLRMGGAFGGKESQANPLAAIAALAAIKTNCPARISFRRHHDMIITGKRHGFLGRYRVGCDRVGKLLALELSLYCDAGWSLDLSSPVLLRAMLHVDNAYY
ncbi:MAG: molybdopterin-dependent oxidoreductase, partial [Merismopedia sp. SIO2A8]|nr:molybdopterin-dependent oxidoreductase [Merismopedia sp. SIO2A8]